MEREVGSADRFKDKQAPERMKEAALCLERQDTSLYEKDKTPWAKNSDRWHNMKNVVSVFEL